MPKSGKKSNSGARNDGLLADAFRGANTLGVGSALSPNKLKDSFTAFSRAGAGAYTSTFVAEDGLADRIVQLPVDAALSRWIEAKDEVLAELDRLNAREILSDAGYFSRLYGGAIIVAFADDGSEGLADPLNEENIKKIHRFKVYDRSEIQDTQQDWDIDPNSLTFGQRIRYTVNPNEPYITGANIHIHHSRCIVIDGLKATRYSRRLNGGWGRSALEPVVKALNNYNYTMSAFPSIAKDFIQTVLKLNRLEELATNNNMQAIRNRIETINHGRSVLNTITIDALDDYQKSASSVSGLDAMVTKLQEAISAACGVPITLMFGSSAKGLNATGEGDANNWYQLVEGFQEYRLTKPINWMLNLLCKQTELKERPEEEDWEWQWPDLNPMGEDKRADIKLKNAQAFQIFMNAGAVEPMYLFHLLYQSKYQFDIEFNPEQQEEFLNEHGLGGEFNGSAEEGTPPTLTPPTVPDDSGDRLPGDPSEAV